MAKSIVITKTTTQTVGGVANVIVADTASSGFYLRRYADNGDYISEHAGASLGVGKWRFDIEEGNYQLWKSPYPDVTAGNRCDDWHGGDGKYRRIQDERDPAYVWVDGVNQMTANLNLGANRATNAADAVDPTDLLSLGQANVLYGGGSVIAGNILFVNADYVTEVAGSRYKTIAAAITYALSQTHDATHIWYIYVFPNKHRANGYAEDITLQAYINLIGLGMVRIKGNMGGFNANTRLENIYVDNTILANWGLANSLAYNCVFSMEDPEATGFELQLSGNKHYGCKYFSVGDFVDTKIISSGTNWIAGGYSNKPIQHIQSTDKIDCAVSNDPTEDFVY